MAHTALAYCSRKRSPSLAALLLPALPAAPLPALPPFSEVSTLASSIGGLGLPLPQAPTST
jgi:hypothetical protein